MPSTTMMANSPLSLLASRRPLEQRLNVVGCWTCANYSSTSTLPTSNAQTPNAAGALATEGAARRPSRRRQYRSNSREDPSSGADSSATHYRVSERTNGCFPKRSQDRTFDVHVHSLINSMMFEVDESFVGGIYFSAIKRPTTQLQLPRYQR